MKILGSGKPGVSSGEAIAEIERIAREVLPPDFSLDWSGASFQEKNSGGTSVLALALGALMVFLILAAQYENWSLPLSVMLALPFGTFGALAAIWINNLVFTPLRRAVPLTNDVYFQIGLVTLLGLAAKNAILIVEYAVLKNDEGLSASAAAVEAARLRFRPILMTSLAFILGVLPLAFSERRRRGRAHLGRHRRDGRHARGDLPRDLLRADLLQADHRPPAHREALERRDQGRGRARAQRRRTRRCTSPHHAPHGAATNEAAFRLLALVLRRLHRPAEVRAPGSRAARGLEGDRAALRRGRPLVAHLPGRRSSRRWSTRRSPATPTC